MNHIHVHIIQTQTAHLLIECPKSRVITLLGITHLSAYPYRLAIGTVSEAGLCQPPTDSGLIMISCGRIYMPITCLQGYLDYMRHTLIINTQDPQPDLRDQISVPQQNLRDVMIHQSAILMLLIP